MSVLDLIADSGKSVISALLTSRILVWLRKDEARSLSLHCRYVDSESVWTMVLSDHGTTEFWAPGATSVYKGVSGSIEELLTEANKVILNGPGRT